MAITFEAQRIILDRCLKDLELCVVGFEQQAEANSHRFRQDYITSARHTMQQLERFSGRLSRIIDG